MEDIIQEFRMKLKFKYGITIKFELINSAFRYKKINKGTIICFEGEIQKYMYYIYSGLFRYYYVDKNGRDITKHFAKEGECAVSYYSFINQSPSQYYVEALEDSEVFAIDYRQYIFNIDNNIDFTKLSLKYVEYIYFKKKKKKLVSF